MRGAAARAVRAVCKRRGARAHAVRRGAARRAAGARRGARERVGVEHRVLLHGAEDGAPLLRAHGVRARRDGAGAPAAGARGPRARAARRQVELAAGRRHGVPARTPHCSPRPQVREPDGGAAARRPQAHRLRLLAPHGGERAGRARARHRLQCARHGAAERRAAEAARLRLLEHTLRHHFGRVARTAAARLVRPVQKRLLGGRRVHLLHGVRAPAVRVEDASRYRPRHHRHACREAHAAAHFPVSKPCCDLLLAILVPVASRPPLT